MKKKNQGNVFVILMLALLTIVWSIPTFGLFISSLRSEDAVNSTGWWTVFSDLKNADLSFENYSIVLTGRSMRGDGNVTRGAEKIQMIEAVINSLTVAIPSTLIPILIAAFAAYGFAWIRFPGRKLLFILVVASMVIPLQIALIPLLIDYMKIDLNGTFLGVWLAHTGFGLSLAIYLLYNYISAIPRDILESAFIDGASHFTIFFRLIFPLSVPALASFAIFQFIWVWNDLLVSLVFLGIEPRYEVLTMRLKNMVGTFGTDWHLLTSGAFVSMLIPMVVFVSLQKYFVRGLLAGSVKG